jgi:hypothetical protein
MKDQETYRERVIRKLGEAKAVIEELTDVVVVSKERDDAIAANASLAKIHVGMMNEIYELKELSEKAERAMV